jgi:hypothetical protein
VSGTERLDDLPINLPLLKNVPVWDGKDHKPDIENDL